MTSPQYVEDQRYVVVEKALRGASSVMASHPTAEQYAGHAEMLLESVSLRDESAVEIVEAIQEWQRLQADQEERLKPRSLPGPKTLRRLIHGPSQPGTEARERLSGDWPPPGSHPLFPAAHSAYAAWCEDTVPPFEVKANWHGTPEHSLWCARRDTWRGWLPRTSKEINLREEGGEDLEPGIVAMRKGTPPEEYFGITLGEVAPKGTDAPPASEVPW